MKKKRIKFLKKFNSFFFPWKCRFFNKKYKFFAESEQIIFNFFKYILKKNTCLKHKFFLRILRINKFAFCYLIYRHTHSNMFFTVLSFWGQVLYTNSGGQSSYARKQTKRGKSIPDTIINLIRNVLSFIKNHNCLRVIFIFRNRPRSFTWSFLSSELKHLDIFIIKYLFICHLAHNGCRKKKLTRK